jgi:aspartate aminotransferase-like enzyme
LDLFADPAFASDTVTGIVVPPGQSAKAIVRTVRDRFGIEIGAGQGRFADLMLRIGHMGWCDEASLRETLDAIQQTLMERGQSPVRTVASVTL